jgi:hypothetical protein
MSSLTPLESAVLEWLFTGEHAVLVSLLAQARKAKVVSREMSGAGFYTNLEIPADVPDAPVRPGVIQFGDVAAQIDGTSRGAGFIIWIRERRLAVLEGYTFEESWPEKVKGFHLSYAKPDRNEALAGLGLGLKNPKPS